MTQQMTADATVNRLEGRLRELHQDANLVRERDRLGEIDASLASLGGRLQALRSGGYLYRKNLEQRLAALSGRWPEARARAAAAADAQIAPLQAEVSLAEAAVRRVLPLRSRPLTSVQPALSLAEAAVSAAERRVSAAREAVESHYQSLAGELAQIDADARSCERTLELLSGATFALEPGEGAVDAVEARWNPGEGEAEGVLFLTDRRLVFERREKVARKKVLFITTASELVKEVRWQVPLADLEAVEASEARQALVLKREVLRVSPQRGADPAAFTLHADSDAWRAEILRCQSGEIAAERTGAVPAAPEYLVPAKCPACGGALRQAGRIRGVSAVRCEFCGASVPLEKAERA